MSGTDRKDFTVASATDLMAFAAFVKKLWSEKKYLTFTWREGEKRSIDQNALMHVWLTEYAAHLLKKDKKLVSKGELEGMKRHAKRMFYAETGYRWLVHEVVNPADISQKKLDFTSSKDWKRPEMYDFMTWLQVKAAGDGLILESKGEYADMQRRNAA